MEARYDDDDDDGRHAFSSLDSSLDTASGLGESERS